MSTPSNIADALGRSQMAEALGVGKTAVSNAVVRGKFPPSWFLVISRMAAGLEIPCPPSAFGMVTPKEDNPQSTDCEQSFPDCSKA
jgi:hypothetical protein